MEDHAAQPGPDGVDPEERLRALEDEIARLKESLKVDDAKKPPPNDNEEGAVELPAASDETAEEGAKPDPAAIAEAENLIKQAHLARIRGQRSVASRFLKEAGEKAPGSAIVHEAIGDDYMERKMYKGAEEAYAKALALDPENKALDRKYGDAVYFSQAAGLGLDLGDADSFASPKAAIWIAILLPGVGQLVAGKIGRGIIIMVGFVGGLILTKIVSDATAKSDTKYLFIAPLAAALGFWLWGIVDMMSKSKAPSPRAPISKPKPPVDLPFE